MQVVHNLIFDNFRIKILSMVLACGLVLYKTCENYENKDIVIEKETKELTK